MRLLIFAAPPILCGSQQIINMDPLMIETNSVECWPKKKHHDIFLGLYINSSLNYRTYKFIHFASAKDGS